MDFIHNILNMHVNYDIYRAQWPTVTRHDISLISIAATLLKHDLAILNILFPWFSAP